MKKIITTILAGTLALSVAAVAAGCSLGGNKNGGDAQNNNGELMQSAESIYGVGAVTTAKLLMETKSENKSLAAVLAAETEPETSNPETTDPNTPTAPETDPNAPDTTEPSAPTTPESNPSTPSTPTAPDYQLPESGDASTDKAQGEADTFNKYFSMLEGFLEKGATTTLVSENDSADPALAAYTTKLIIKGKNELGEENVHTMYYTETKLESYNDRDLDDDYDDDDDDEFKTVEAWTLEGVLEMGTDASGAPVYYYMTGSRRTESETEGRETEEKEELFIRAYADKNDKLNYVMMKHETETESEGNKNESESEYVYSVYQNGRLVESTSVDFEVENNEAEYELSYTKGNVTSTYEIEKIERNGSTWIEVEYRIGNDRGKFVIVRDADGNFDYKYTQKTSDDRHFDRYDD